MSAYLSPSQDPMGTPDHRLEILGLRCPVPLLMTSRCLSQMAPGQRLLVVGDDPEMLSDLGEWCSESGHRMVAQHERDGQVSCLLEKSGERAID